MSTTYTTNYHLGKQTDTSDTFDMSVITDNMNIIDTQMKSNENNISSVLDANGKKQLIPNFGVLTSGNITYTQNGTSITVTGSKNSDELNYVNVISAPYEYFGLKANDKIVVKNSDSSPVYVGVGFDNGGYTVNPTLVVGGTQELTLPSDKTYMYIRIGLLNSTTTVSKTIRPLICDKKLYDVSQTVSQYAMSNAELTAAIQTLQAQLSNTTIKIISKEEYDSIVHDENTVYYVKDGDKVVQYLGDAKFGTGSTSGSSSLYGVAYDSINGDAEFSEIS